MSQLESDLRTWMHGRAARVHASPRLLEADYHPRAPRRRPRIAIGGGVVTAVGTLAAVAWLAGGTSPAFAGWSPVPTRSTPAQRAAAHAYCAKNSPQAGLPLRLTDTRGPFMILVYSNGSWNDFCTFGPSFRNVSSWSTSPPVRPPNRKLFLWTDHTSTGGGASYGSMIASAGIGVRAVTLTLDDGSRVTTTVEHHWVVAWWPGAHHVAAAQLTTPSGTWTQTFPAYPCDVYSCAGGGPHGGSPNGGPGGG